jgi:hypothetical protein
MKPTAETIKLALKIADSCARSDVECNCEPVGNAPNWSWDLNSIDEGCRDEVMESVRYCDLRGLINRPDPSKPHIVNFEVAA